MRLASGEILSGSSRVVKYSSMVSARLASGETPRRSAERLSGSSLRLKVLVCSACMDAV